MYKYLFVVCLVRWGRSLIRHDTETMIRLSIKTGSRNSFGYADPAGDDWILELGEDTRRLSVQITPTPPFLYALPSRIARGHLGS